ncbi:hypothetical protein ROHU_012168 [Labeo rohita]|uniref:Uncharacterized protein n=1 Tax=Labeo rohita TaxID=84645 RepID=A0A498LMV6_LABRO|nr:hypothetical protein ROHU_012168 [Labeo rohita]
MAPRRSRDPPEGHSLRRQLWSGLSLSLCLTNNHPPPLGLQPETVTQGGSRRSRRTTPLHTPCRHSWERSPACSVSLASGPMGVGRWLSGWSVGHRQRSPTSPEK